MRLGLKQYVIYRECISVIGIQRPGKYDNICFEDLPSEAQDDILGRASHEFIRGMVRGLADTLNHIGDQLDLTKD